MSVLITAGLLFASCNTSRLITPIEKKTWQVSASAGGPIIGAPLPLSSVSAAYGLQEKTSVFTGLQLTSLMYNTVQFDIGANRLLREPDGFIPGFAANGVLNTVYAMRDKSTVVFPELSGHAYYNITKFLTPYVGMATWYDLGYKDRDVNEGSLIHPTIYLGVQGNLGRVQLALETKWLNFNKDVFIPQVNHTSFGENGAAGVYLRFSYSLQKKQN